MKSKTYTKRVRCLSMGTDSKMPIKEIEIYTVGQHVGGCEILGIYDQSPSARSEYKYWIRHLCCDKERAMTYRALRDRALRNSTLCVYCNRTAQLSKSWVEPAPVELEGALDATGRLWPHLGKMGHRYGGVASHDRKTNN